MIPGKSIGRFINIALLAMAASMLFSHRPATAQSLPGHFMAPAAGTVMIWHREQAGSQETRENTFLQSSGNRITFKRRGTDLTTWVPFCWGCASNKFEEDKYNGLWPLAIGKTVSFARTRERDGNKWLHTISVVKIEKVSTPAGNFEAYVVEEQARSTSGNWSATSRHWWAPAIGYIVRSEEAENDGKWSKSSLTAIKSP